jgi:hypothetical protein
MAISVNKICSGRFMANGAMFIKFTPSQKVNPQSLKYVSSGSVWWGIKSNANVVVSAATTAILKVINVSYSNISYVMGVAKANISKIINIS